MFEITSRSIQNELSELTFRKWRDRHLDFTKGRVDFKVGTLKETRYKIYKMSTSILKIAKWEESLAISAKWGSQLWNLQPVEIYFQVCYITVSKFSNFYDYVANFKNYELKESILNFIKWGGQLWNLQSESVNFGNFKTRTSS